MNIRILIIFFLFTYISFGQGLLCNTNIIGEEYLKENNEIDKFAKHDFSSIWIKTDNEFVYGIIGQEYQRILIKLVKIVRNLNNQNEYLVYGKSYVKGNICNFVGKITIIKNQTLISQKLGVDDEYKNAEIKDQGLLTAKYEFFENKNKIHSGQFQGTLQTEWYLDKNNIINYNDIDLNSDGYFNNAFVGIWKKYNSNIEKICNWGDYRVPNSNCDFDIGAGELSIAEKYIKNGWWVKPKQKWWE